MNAFNNQYLRLLLYRPMLRRFHHQYRGTRVLVVLRRPTLFIYKKNKQPLLRRLLQPTNNLRSLVYRLIFEPFATVTGV